MTKIVHALLVCLLFSDFSPAQTNPPKITQSEAGAKEVHSTIPERAASLPVRRVVLYKNGVGYFEHLGRIRDNQTVHVDFTSAQLNDVLKSLTALDLSGGHITGVDYNSEAPLARRLATLRLALGEKPGMADFLAALRGARLEVRSGSGTSVTGKLLSVEQKSRVKDNGTTEWTEIALVSD